MSMGRGAERTTRCGAGRRFCRPLVPSSKIAALLALLLFSSSGRALADPAPVPEPLPAAYAVMALENRSGVSGLEWMERAMAFTVAEKAEGLALLRPVPGGWADRPASDVPESELIAAFGRDRGAQWVWTGYIDRPEWELELGLELWEVTEAGAAVRRAEVARRGEFQRYADFAGEAILEIAAAVGLRSAGDDESLVARVPSADFYAFTIFGRGLDAIAAGERRDERASLDKARRHLDRAVLIDPQLAEAWLVGAALAQKSDRRLQAAVKLRRALELRPRYPAAVVLAAESALLAGHVERAVSLYVDALNLRPWDLETRFAFGKLQWEMGKIDASFRELSQVVAHEPGDIRAHRLLVLIHAARGDGDELIREQQEVMKLAPKDLSIRLDLAASYAASGRSDDAIATYLEVAKLDPDNVQALKFLGDLYTRVGKPDRAIRYYGLALKAAPTDPRPYFLLGAAYLMSGDDSAAKRIFRRAQRFKTFRAEAFSNLGAIAYREGRVGESMWYLRRAVQQKPGRARYRYNYALGLSASSSPREALKHIEKGIALDPEHVDLHYLDGVVRLRLGDGEGARSAFQRTLDLAADHRAARHNLELLDEMRRRSREGEVVIEGP